MISINEFIVYVGSSVGLAGIMLWLSKTWLSERLKQSIKYEYDLKLEESKTKLEAENKVYISQLQSLFEKELAVHKASHASFIETQKATINRRLKAIEIVWGEFLRIKYQFSDIYLFLDILTDQELESAQLPEPFQLSIKQLSLNEITDFAKSAEEPEGYLPYLDNYVWSLFYVYRAITYRTIFLVERSKTENGKIEWHKDDGIIQYYTSFLSEKEINELQSLKIGKHAYIRRSLESKLLKAMNGLISGKQLSEELLHQSQQIIKVVKENKPIN